MIKHGNLTARLGPVYIEAGYLGGMYEWGEDAIADLEILRYVRFLGGPYLSIFSIRIWRIVLSLSVDFKKEVER